MKAITEEKRQELIEHCKEGLEIWGHQENIRTVYEIALASLEAEPQYIRLFGNYGYGDRCWVECAKSEQGAIAHYTAPTVPVFPDLTALDCLAGEFCQSGLDSNGRESKAFMKCAHRLAETVKEIRLNGIKS